MYSPNTTFGRVDRVNWHRRDPGRVVRAMCVLLALGSSAWAAPPEGNVQSKRPIVKAVLNDGSQVEGVLQRFSSGVYTVNVNGQFKSFIEANIQSISFHAQPALRQESGGNGQAIAELIKQFRRTTNDPEGIPQRVGPSVIPKLAAMGPAVIEPLVAEVNKDSDIYQSVGLVFKQLGPEAIPQLLESVRKDPSGSARLSVWWALRETGVAAVPHLKKMMTDSDPRIRKTAMDLLHSLSTQAAVAFPGSLDRALIAALDDPDLEVRQQVPLVLGRISTASELVLPTLLKTLKDGKERSVRSNTVIALGYIGRDLNEGDADLKRIVDALSAATVDDSESLVRGYSALYLGQLGTKAEAAVPALIRATDDQTENVRNYALEALLKIKSTLDVLVGEQDLTGGRTAKLFGLLANKNSTVRQWAADQLATLGPENLDALIVAVRADKDNRYWPAVAQIFAKWGPKMAPKLESLARDEEHYRVRRTIAVALGQMPLEAVPDELRAMVRDEHQWVRMTAVDSIVKLSRSSTPEMQDSAVPALIEALDDEVSQIRRKAIDALAEVGPVHTGVIPALMRALKEDKEPWARRDAASELGRMAGRLRAGDKDLPRIVAALAKAVEEGRNEDVRRYAISALGNLGPRAAGAIPAL
ncbi:MAG: HEAT repeat domain-containing protein, partial [Planctomycetota bacterium]